MTTVAEVLGTYPRTWLRDDSRRGQVCDVTYQTLAPGWTSGDRSTTMPSQPMLVASNDHQRVGPRLTRNPWMTVHLTNPAGTRIHL